MRILVVEDEPTLAEDLKAALERENYVVEVVGDGEAAWFQAEVENYDAMVLDLGLPRLDGVSVIRRLRAADIKVPIIVVTARDRWIERVEAIDSGADDYLVKPIHMQELLARLRAVLRRSAGHASPILKAADVELDTRTREVSVKGQPVRVTAMEHRLLSYFMHRQGILVGTGELLEHLYGTLDRDFNTVEVLLMRLRRKVGARIIETRMRQGYMVAPPDAS